MLQYFIKQILTNINKYILHDLSIELRDNLYFSFSIPTPGFPHFYFMLGANLGLPLYGEVSMMRNAWRINQNKDLSNPSKNIVRCIKVLLFCFLLFSRVISG